MPPKRFGVLYISFKKKNLEHSHKMKECKKKNVINKKKLLKKCYRQKLYFGTLVLAVLQCYYGDIRDKIQTSFKTFFERKQQHGSSKKTLDKNKFI